MKGEKFGGEAITSEKRGLRSATCISMKQSTLLVVKK